MTTDRLHHYSVACNGLFSCLLCLIYISSRNHLSCCTCYISSRLLDSYHVLLHVSIHSNCTHIWKSQVFLIVLLSSQAWDFTVFLERLTTCTSSSPLAPISFICFTVCFMGSTQHLHRMLESTPSSEAIASSGYLSSRTPKTILSFNISSVLSPN